MTCDIEKISLDDFTPSNGVKSSTFPIMSATDKAYNYIMTCDIENIGLDGGYPSVDGVKTRSFPVWMGGWLILRRGSDMFLFPRYISCHMNITHRRLSERLNASQEIYDRLDDIKRILSL